MLLFTTRACKRERQDHAVEKSWDLLSLLLGRQKEKMQQRKFPTSTPKHPEVSRRTSSLLQSRMGHHFPHFKKQGMKSIPVQRSSMMRCLLWYLVVWMEHQLSDPEKSLKRHRVNFKPLISLELKGLPCWVIYLPFSLGLSDLLCLRNC